jgi:uncharacterized protein (DUF488 family)
MAVAGCSGAADGHQPSVELGEPWSATTDRPQLVTFGYQACPTPAVLGRVLDAGGVERVVDVRLHAYSGIKGFSSDTRQTVEAAGREYVWAHQLGNLAYKTQGRIEIKDIGRLDDLVLDPLRQGVTVALMCACASVERCHRCYLAEIVTERLPGVEIVHL